MNTHDKGELAEIIAIKAAIENGYKVSKPLGQNTRYDLVLDKDGKLYRAQVKHCPAKNGAFRIKTNSVSTKNGKTIASFYDSSQIDLFLAINFEKAVCIVLPVDLAENCYSLSIRYETTKNNQTEGTYHINDFQVWAI